MNFLNWHQSSLDCKALWDRINSAGLYWIPDGSGVFMGNTQSGGLPISFKNLCAAAIEEIQFITGLPAKHIMVNRLPAGIIVPIHTDTVLGRPDRYHLPLVTDIRHCQFWDELRGFQTFQAGYWYRVDYSIKHTIMNLGTEERVHLIVDVCK